jgi:diguanylate cyclase (GGDEF)-like protein
MSELLEDHSMSESERLALALRLARTGHPTRAYAMATAALARATDERRRAEWADCLADCCLKLVRYEAGITYTKQAAAIWQRQGEVARFAQSLGYLAEFLSDVGAPDAATTAQQALGLAQRSGDPAALAHTHSVMGVVLFMARQADKAVPFCERAVAIKRQAKLDMTVLLINCAEAIVLAGAKAAAAGDEAALPAAVARAVALTREAVAEARDLGDGWAERLALNNIAEYSMYIDDVATAAASLAEVAAAPGEPSLRCRAHYLSVHAKVLAGLGRLDEARQTFRECLDEVGEGNYLELEVDSFAQLTKVLERMGRFEEALQAHREFHARYVRLASEGAQRLARLAAQEHEIKELRDAADHAQSLAASLVRSNAELALETERLMRANLEDSLTGLPNRRRLEMALAALTAGADHFACAMLDVDHFKQVNDRFSHVVGDAVLRKIGEIFTRLARHDDLLARFGGEEFALLINSADTMSVLNVCERLRIAVEETDWETIQPGLSIRISVGFAMGHEAERPELVMKLADQRLYAAKGNGRNRVVGPASA